MYGKRRTTLRMTDDYGIERVVEVVWSPLGVSSEEATIGDIDTAINLSPDDPPAQLYLDNNGRIQIRLVAVPLPQRHANIQVGPYTYTEVPSESLLDLGEGRIRLRDVPSPNNDPAQADYLSPWLP